MKFRTGFVVGCAAGAWAAAKVAELRHVETRDSSWPRVVGSRAKNVSAEVAADKVRAVSDLARERMNFLMESPIGGLARQRVTEILTTTLRPSSGAERDS
jgi:hypothetical protein